MITTKGRYAMRVMIRLAEVNGDNYLPLSEIAASEGISDKYLENVIRPLVKEGMVEPQRGKSGGYRLVRTPKEYTLGDIIGAVERTMAPVACLEGSRKGCERSSQCKTFPIWKRLDSMINGFFEGITLANVLEGALDSEAEDFVYADNGATTKMSKAAIAAASRYTEDNYGNPSSLYTMGQKSREAVEGARARIAEIIGGKSNEIIFTSGGSESDNHALFMAAELAKKKGKNHIISSQFEHHAVLHTLDRLKERGFEITLLPVHENGLISPEELREAITLNTGVVSIMYANNEIGTVQPISEIGAICREKGILFHTDAVQAVGHIPVDVRLDNIDMLSMSAHKFHGPKGVGALYVRTGIRVSPYINGGAQERGKRAGTENVSGIMAMAAALSEANENMPQNIERITKMRDRLIDELLKIPHSVLNGDRCKRLPGNVNICFEAIEGESLLLLLDDAGIAASSGSACTSGSLEPSHVLLAIGRPHEIAHGSLRLSLSEYNTDSDIDKIIREVPRVVEQLRSFSPIWNEQQKGNREYVIQ